MEFDHVRPRDVVVAGAIGGLVAGIPSTAYALATRRDPFEASVAAGTLVLPGERRPIVLLAAALPVHAALSVGWAGVLAAVPLRRRTAKAGAGGAAGAPGAARAAAIGAAAGLAIAAVDLGLVGRRFPRIRALPLLPQVADHVAYGSTVGWVLARRRGGGVRRDPRDVTTNW
ncbi:MAG TPA: hypothetical protein VFU43_28330 [Streptosporangiaceae bacterium]|nr:hypothetical protein [Streptosporangiaceae bacterium]